MRKKFVNVNLIYFVFVVIVFASLTLPAFSDKVFARVIEGISVDDRTTTDSYTKIEEINKKSNEDLYHLFETGYNDNYEEENVTIIPSLSTTTTPAVPISMPMTTPANNGNYSYYRQCDYQDIMPQGCSICKAGCGITAVSTIVASLGFPSENPISVMEKYRQRGFYAGCSGTSIGNAKSILESYGLSTSNYLFQNSSGYEINAVAEDIRRYTQSGWVVLALTNFCEGGCGHFIVLTDIDSSNNVTSFDPWYEQYSPSQPISYESRSPFPKYRYAIAVKK